MIYHYDGSNEKCPLPLVNLRLIIKNMQKGDSCLIKVRDSGSKEDIPKLLSKLGYCYNQSPIDNNVVEITISKDD
jgi:TusA-related sulfurtransferase